MSDENEERLGAGMPLIDSLKLLAQYAPLLLRLQAIANEPDAYHRAVAIVGLLKWAAAKTEGTHLDDDAVQYLQNILASAEGKAFFDWIVKTVEVTA
ncbi:MAG: hypothetical protein EBR82_38625 [Caulobacteraceae bacterium]|nr:hypothetical protein [Caulobacteraceae bacterium]